MTRFFSFACFVFSLLVMTFVACGNGTDPGTDVIVDSGDRDTSVVDLIVNDVEPDSVVDSGGRDVMDVEYPDVFDSVETDSVDIIDDVAADDGGVATDMGDIPDEGPGDGEVCVGPECYPACEDDGLICTDEIRNIEGECESVLRDDFCFIDDECFFRMQPSEENPCLACDPDKDQSDFSPAVGMPCDDGDPCTGGDTCNDAGVCVAGDTFGCDDDNPCTIDLCDDRLGCTHTPRASTCDDGNECTYQDQCNTTTGVCEGFQRSCNDGKVCTRDYCDPLLGCVYESEDKACDDYDGCTVNDWCDPEGNCVGEVRICDDGDECTTDECAGGECFNDWYYGPCDDGNECTDNDYCSAHHNCVGTPKESCDDFNVCTTDYCDPEIGCVNEYNNLSCEPESACEVNGVCSEGVCVGQPRDCEDGNYCTVDTCDEVTGCHHVITSGICDDHNECTVNENCASGVCQPPEGPSGVRDCDDLNECTVDNCDPVIGCVHTPQEGQCQDLNPCSLSGTGYCEDGVCVSNLRDCDDNQPCTLDTCDGDGNCIHVPITGPCDDGDYCTVGETCQEGECQGGGAIDCDDNSVCTIDACNPDFGCLYTPTSGLCDDDNVCTINDQCVNGECHGTERVCEDHNVCTDNACDTATGCFYTPNSIECDDANECTYDDICGAGECHGVSVFSDPASKAATLLYGVNGNMGQGIDVDADVTTCAPKGSCVQGIDNSFSKLHWLFNTEMLDAASDGSYSMLLEHEDLKTDGSEYELKFYWGARVDPVTCDPTTNGCNYSIYDVSLRTGCEAVNTFYNARINGTRLQAGGAAYEIPFNIVFGDSRVPITMFRVGIVANVSIENGKVVGGGGVLGGAIRFQDLLDAIDSMPDSAFLPRYDKSIIMSYIDIYMKPDIDLDSDGTDESVSVGLPFTIVTGHLVGPL